jgi:DNA-directed RNA polymerase I subunit RPA43
VIPKTTTYKQFKEKKARDDAAAASAAPVAPGQTTLQNGFGGAAPAGHLGAQLEESSREESNGISSTSKLPLLVNGSPMADRTLNVSVHGHPFQEAQSDVEMKDEAIS